MAETARLFVAVYTDEDITRELAPALRERGFDALSANEAGMLHADDIEQLRYAAQHDMALLTCNADDFLSLAQQYAQQGLTHSGIIVSSEQFSRRRFGELLRLMLVLLNARSAEELHNTVIYLQQFRA